MFNRFWLLAFLLFTTNLLSAQDSDLLNQVIQKSLSGGSYYVEFEQVVQQFNSYEQLSSIESLLESDNPKVRYLLYNIIYRIAKASKGVDVKSRAIYLLISKGISDVDLAIGGRNIELLLEFDDSDFNQQARTTLSALVINSKSNISELTKLAGKVKLVEVISAFEQRLTVTKNSIELWQLHCSLARIGDVSQKKYCLNRVKQLGLNDQVIQDLIPDVLFTQNADAVFYLLDAISVDNMNCSSFNPDRSEKVNCAYRLIELVAPYISDFPVSVGESGDLNVANYDIALMQVRDWIKIHRTSCQVVF